MSDAIELPEWGRTQLAGRWLRDDEARVAAARLLDEGRLEVRELRAGLEILARAYVGEVELGDLLVRIVPKLNPDALRRLLAFSHGAGASGPGEAASGRPAEMLAARLASEVEALLARGLAADYIERGAWLSSPRGRLDTAALAARGALVDAALPCRFADRGFDTALHRALLAGLVEARSAAPSLASRLDPLSAHLRRLARAVPLDDVLLALARARLHPATLAYEPALGLIEALRRGVVAAGGSLPAGFLFDMSRFFQAIVGRLLRGFLRNVEIHEEWSLHDVLRYAPDANPHQRRPPTPRPDFALFERGQLTTLLDAKYRDLWAEPLPRDMLYQLTLYALGHGRAAVIVYPSDDPYARESRIELRQPGGDWGFRTVVLRPLPLTRLAHLLETPSHAARRELEALAQGLAAA